MDLYQKALDIKKRSLGNDHSSVANTYNNMGLVRQNQCQWNEAIGLHQKSLEIKDLTEANHYDDHLSIDSSKFCKELF